MVSATLPPGPYERQPLRPVHVVFSLGHHHRRLLITYTNSGNATRTSVNLLDATVNANRTGYGHAMLVAMGNLSSANATIDHHLPGQRHRAG